MGRQDLEQLARAQAPQVDVIGFHRASCDNITALFDGEARELRWLVRLESAEVAIFDEVIGSYSTIHTGTKHSVALLWQELKCSDLSGMLSEGHEAESIFDRPKLNFAIVTTRGNQRAIRRVSHSIQIKEVTLLLKNVGFTLPLPHK